MIEGYMLHPLYECMTSEKPSEAYALKGEPRPITSAESEYELC